MDYENLAPGEWAALVAKHSEKMYGCGYVQIYASAAVQLSKDAFQAGYAKGFTTAPEAQPLPEFTNLKNPALFILQPRVPMSIAGGAVQMTNNTDGYLRVSLAYEPANLNPADMPEIQTFLYRYAGASEGNTDESPEEVARIFREFLRQQIIKFQHTAPKG